MSFSYFIMILKMKICRIVKIFIFKKFFCLDSSKGELSEAQIWPTFHGLWLDPYPFGLKKLFSYLLRYYFQFHAEVELAQGPIIPKEGEVVESKAYRG